MIPSFPGAPARPEFPPVDDALVDAVARVFPDRAPESGLTNDEIRERIGEVRVLRFLKHQRDRQRRLASGRIERPATAPKPPNDLPPNT